MWPFIRGKLHYVLLDAGSLLDKPLFDHFGAPLQGIQCASVHELCYTAVLVTVLCLCCSIPSFFSVSRFHFVACFAACQGPLTLCCSDCSSTVLSSTWCCSWWPLLFARLYEYMKMAACLYGNPCHLILTRLFPRCSWPWLRFLSWTERPGVFVCWYERSFSSRYE